jgi:hypothetical protein
VFYVDLFAAPVIRSMWRAAPRQDTAVDVRTAGET